MKRSGKLLVVLLAASMTLSLLPVGVLGAGSMDPGEARSKDLAQPQAVGEVTAAEKPAGSAPGNNLTGGIYVVSQNMSLSDLRVSGNTTIYLAAGATLTVTGTASTTPQTGKSVSASTAPAAIPNAPGGRNGITITGGTLTFTGPGNLIVSGGAGARGADSTEYSAYNMNNGGGGGRGGDGIFVAAGATLKFAETFTGAAAITGGTGGAGGTGQQAQSYVQVVNDNARSYAIPGTSRVNRSGNGGNGGYAGYGIAASDGTVVFAQDGANTTLVKEGGYTTGSINVKGGVGGTGGTAGQLAAGTSIASNVHGIGSGSPSGSAIATANAQVTSQGATLTVSSAWSKTSESNGSYTVNYSVAGSGGIGGVSGYGIGGGAVRFEGGVTGIEGGNSGGTSATWNVITGTHNYYDNGYASAAQGIKKTTNSDGSESETSITGSTVAGYNMYSCGLTASAIGSIYNVSATAALSDATVYNNGGMSYAVYGDDGVGNALNNTTVTSGSNTTGSFYNGNGVAMAPNATGNVSGIRVYYLEGAGDFATSAKNFYVLNKGDTWTDADGTKHTSKGLLVNGISYGTRDLYVSPQGYLYLSGVTNGASIELDLAVGATRNSKAGEAVKEIRLSDGSEGIYHFKGNTAGVYARYALDSLDDTASLDSSFDLHWLQGVDFKKAVEVSTAPQLAAVAWAVNKGVPGAAEASYTLTADLNLGNFDWTPIGTQANPFKGTFDGGAKTLYNLRVRQIEDVTGYGLFGWAEDATLINFKLARDAKTVAHTDTVKSNSGSSAATSGGEYDFKVPSKIAAITDSAHDLYIGAALGHGMDTTVGGVTVTDLPIETVTGKTVMLGGLVGYLQDSALTGSTVTNTSDHTLSAAATGDAYTGGLIGWADRSDVTGNTANGYNTVKAKSTAEGNAWAGGAVAKSNGTTEQYVVVTGNNITATTATVSATATKGDAYAAGLVGQALYANVKGLADDHTQNKATGYQTVKAESTTEGSAWAGGAVGKIEGTDKNFAIVTGNVVSTASGSVTAKAVKGDVYAAGLVGQAGYTDVTDNSATGYDVMTATASDTGAAWAAGGVGLISGDGRTAAVATGNTVTGAANVTITATAAGAADAAGKTKDAHAGGFLGEGLEVAAYSNTFTGGDSNAVTAYAPTGVSWAGGLLGHVQNDGYGRIAVSDMTVANVAVTAKGAIGDKAGKEAYAGGVIGEGIAKNGVELVNLNVNGAKGVTAAGTLDTYAGRLAGHVNKTSVINCAFDNTSDVAISGASSDADAYVGGLVGMLEESGSVNASGVWRTNVSASAAADRTAWAGGLLGYADETSITASSVNYRKPDTGADVAGSFASSTLTVTGAKNTYAGGIAGEIVNTTRLNKPGEHTYKINNAVSVTMTLPATGVTAGGLFGKLNDGLVGTSYARNYIIQATGQTGNANPPAGKVAGVAGVLNGSELIAVYGVGKDGNVITTYPGMYAEGGNDSFYGCYVLHDSFAPRPERDVNVYGNTYYVGTGSIDLIPIEDSEATPDNPVVNTATEALPYYEKGSDGLYELKTSYTAKTYQNTNLTALPVGSFNNARTANDSMWDLLHFYKDKSDAGTGPSVISTRFEQRLGYAIAYDREDNSLKGNFKCPMVTTPYAFTLAVQPGLDYGHIKENRDGQTFSTYHEPGTKTYTPDTKLLFTAEEQPTLPQDKVFYVFTGWKYLSGAATTHGWKIDEETQEAVEDTSVTIAKSPTINASTTNPIRINSVNSYMTLTALFERRDNQIRGEINKALSDAMKAVTQDEAFVAELNKLLTDGFPQDASNAMLDKLYASDESGKANLDGMYKAFEKWVNTDTKTDLSGKDFGTIYPNAHEDLWDDITDHEAVVKQIVRDAVEQMMAADRFQAGSYDTDITEIAPTLTDDEKEFFTKGDKLDFVDVGVDLFTTGNFAKYEETQKAFEQSGTTDTGDNSNTAPGILSFAGTTATLADLLGGKGGYALSYIDPATVGVDGVYTPVDAEGKPIEGEVPYDIWNAAAKGADGKYTYDIDPDKLVTEKDTGKQYVYLRQTDANGYQVTTRIEVGCNTVAAENSPVNAGNANVGVGDGTEGVRNEETGEVVQPLRTEHTEMWFGPVDLAKGESNTKLDVVITGRPAPNAGAEDKKGDPYYYNGKGGEKQKDVFVSAPISGAYTKGLYVEIDTEFVGNPDLLKEKMGAGNVLEILNEEGEVAKYEVKLTGEETELTAAQGLISVEGQEPVEFKTQNVQPDATATPDAKLTGTVTYEAVNGFTVKAKYVNLIGELNAAEADITLEKPGETPEAPPVTVIITPVEQVHNLLNDHGFAGAMGVDSDVMNAYKGMTETDEATGAETNPIDAVVLAYRPNTGGYPDADAVKDLFTYATALNELLDVMDAHQETLDSLSAADKTNVAELRKRAENLLSGKNYAGDAIAPDALALNGSLLYNTGDNLYKLLGNVYYDSVVITIQTNFGGYMKPAKGGAVGLMPSFVTETLFGKSKVEAPAAANVMSLFAETKVLDSVAYVVGKNKEATLILDGAFFSAGYEVKSVTGTPALTFTRATGTGTGYAAGDYIAKLTANQVTDNLNYTILFAKRVYDVTIPAEITDGADPATTIAAVEATGTTLDGENGNLTGSVIHGESVTVTVTPAEGYVTVPGGEVTYKVTMPDGTEQSKTANLAADGTVVLPNAEGKIFDVDLTKAVAKTDVAGLGSYLTETGKLKREDYTPETWTAFKKVEDAATAVKTKAEGELGEGDDKFQTEEERTAAVKQAHDDLVAAQAALVKQYEVTPGNDFKVVQAIGAGPSAGSGVTQNEINTAYSGTSVTYCQGSGVVKIGDKYYVQEGAEVELEPTTTFAGQIGAGGDKTLVGVTYTQGETTGKKAILVTDNNHIILPNVTGAVTALTPETKTKTFTVLPGKDTTGTKGTASVPAYTLPDAKVEGIGTEAVTTITASVIDENNTQFDIDVAVDEHGTATGITVTPLSGTEVDLTANAALLGSLTGLTGGTVAGSNGTATLAGTQLQAILDVYNKDAHNTPKAVVGKNTTVSAEVTVANSGGTGSDATTNDGKVTTDTATVPTYTLTHEAGKHVAEVTVDKYAPIALPTDDISEILTGEPVKNSDGTWTYTKTDPDKGGKTTVTTDGDPAKGGKPVSVTVDPGVDVGVTVTFPVDLDAANFGEATVTWKAPNNNTHTMTVKTESNVYDFTSKQPAIKDGTALVKTTEIPDGAETGSVTHGSSPELVIQPATGMRVDPNAKVTITMAGIQGSEGVTVTDTLKNLADKALYPNLFVTGVNRDGTVNPDASVTVAVLGVTGPLSVDASGAFRSAKDLKPDDMKNDLNLLLDGLKQSIALGDAIVANKAGGPYVTTDDKWDAFAGDHTATPVDKGGKLAAASEALYNKLTKDGETLNTITEATTETALVDAVNKALGLTGNQKLDSFTQVVNAVAAAKDGLDDAILNLTPKTSGGAHEIPVLPGLSDKAGKPILGVDAEGAALMPGQVPAISNDAADGGLAPGGSLEISNVTPKPGQVVDKVTVTVTDPDTGKEYTAEIPVNGGADVGENGIKVYEKAPDGALTEIAPDKLPGGAIADTVKGGTVTDGTASVPGKTIQAVVDAVTGTKQQNGAQTAGSGDGVITGVAVSTGQDTGFDVGAGPTHTSASVDAGVKTTDSAAPTVDTVGSDGNSNSGAGPEKNTTVELGTDGLKVTPVTPNTGYVYKGVEVTVVDKDGIPHVVTIPADSSNTTDDTSTAYNPSANVGDNGNKAPFTTTIKPDDLKAAVKAAIKADTGAEPSDEDLAAAIVTDVKVITDALPATLPNGSEATGGNGINTDTGESGTKPTVTLPTTGTGTADTGDLTVDNITPAPGFQVGGLVVEITDPTTGKTVGVVVPAGETAPNLGGKSLDVIDPATGDKLGTVTLPAATPPENGDKGGTVDAGGGTSDTDKVTVPGKTIQDIIDALKDPHKTTSDDPEKPATITGGALAGVTVEGERAGHALPEPDKVTGDRGTDPAATPSVSDKHETNPADGVLTPDTESLVVDNIKPKEHFQVDGITVTLTDGTKVTLPRESDKAAEGATVTVTVTTPEGVSEEKTVTVPNNTGVTFEETDGTDGNGKITVDGGALEAIIKAALGDTGPDTVADTDITDVRVNTSAKPDVIGLPESAGTDEHQTTTPTVEVTEPDGTAADAIIDPDAPGEGSVVVDNIQPDPAFGTKDVTITVNVPTADRTGSTDYQVTIPAGKPAPDLDKLSAIPVGVDGKPTGEPAVTVDLSGLVDGEGKPRTDQGGTLAPGDGTHGTDKITIPNATVADIIAKLTPEYAPTDPGSSDPDPRPTGTVSGVTVNTERTGHKVPDHTTTLAGGVADKGIVQVWTNNPTSEPSKLDPSKGLTVTGVQAKNEDPEAVETVTGVTITTAGGTVITVKPDGAVTAVKNGEELVLGTSVKATVTDGDGDPATTSEPFDLALSGAVLDTILAAAGETGGAGSVQKVEINTEKSNEDDPTATEPGAPGRGSLNGWLSAAADNTPKVIENATQDLVVDNVKVAPGYTYTGVTLTLSDGTSVSVPKQSVTAADGNAQVTVTVTRSDGIHTETKTVTLPQHVKSQTDLSSGAEKTTVPGASLDEIIKAALENNESDVVRVDIDAEETGYVMPAAKVIGHDNGSHGLTALTIKNGTGADADQSTGTDLNTNSPAGDTKEIVVPHTGELVLELTYEKDDGIYGEEGQTYHTFSGLTVGGVNFDAAALEALGVIVRENTDAVAHLDDETEMIVLDAQKLANQYKLTTGKDFPGFGDLTLQTVPQNSQYASFVENYGKLQGMLGENGKPTGDYAYGGTDRTAYEELVQKLAEQFKAGTADELKGDNLDHLLDKKVVLDGLQQEIDDLRKADQVRVGIGDATTGTTGSVNTALGEKGIDSIDDAIAALVGDNEEEKNKVLEAVTDELRNQIRDLVNDSAKLPDSAKDQVWPGGHDGTAATDTNAKLKDLEDLLNAVERSSMTANEYLNKLLNDLPTIPNIRGGDTASTDDNSQWDSVSGNSVKDGKSLTDRIKDLKAAEAAIEKVVQKIDEATVKGTDEEDYDENTHVTPDQMNALLERLSVQQEKLDHELEDLAKVFAKDYLTTDDNKYGPGSSGGSADSGNGIKANTDKIKDLTSNGMAAYNKLPPSAQAAVDELFHGPTLSELHEEAFATGSVSGGLLDKEGIFNALDKDGNHTNNNHLNADDLNGDNWNEKVTPSDKTVSQWVDDILALEPSYNALTSSDQEGLNSDLTNQSGSRYPDLLDRANELVADKFVKDNHLNELGPVTGDTLTPAQKDLVDGAHREWNGLTQDQKAKVNEKVSAITGGKTYEDLLDMLTPAPDAGDIVIITQRPGGTVSVDPQKPKKGDTVTITVAPNSGYTANAPTVKDQNGQNVPLTKNPDGTYTYTQPDGQVTITGSFTKTPTTNPDTPVTPGTPGGTGGGGGSSVTVEVGKTEHGAVSVDSDTAKKNDTVTITVTPDPGYVTDKVTVTDKDGKELPLTDNGDGTYTYTQPSGKVTVDAVFCPVTGDPRDNGVAGLLTVDDHIAFMQGRSAEVFAPGENMTRAEAAQMFYNLLKDKNGKGTETFADVAPDAWYAKAVTALAELGVVSGVGEGKFAPDRTITRAEFVVIATRFADYAPGTAGYSDVGEDFWAYEAIGTASYYGWINGYTDGTFRPLALITRAEAAKVVNAMLGRSADKRFIDQAEGLKLFPDVSRDNWAFYEIAEATNAHRFTVTDGVESWKPQ